MIGLIAVLLGVAITSLVVSITSAQRAKEAQRSLDKVTSRLKDVEAVSTSALNLSEKLDKKLKKEEIDKLPKIDAKNILGYTTSTITGLALLYFGENEESKCILTDKDFGAHASYNGVKFMRAYHNKEKDQYGYATSSFVKDWVFDCMEGIFW